MQQPVGTDGGFAARVDGGSTAGESGEVSKDEGRRTNKRFVRFVLCTSSFVLTLAAAGAGGAVVGPTIVDFTFNPPWLDREGPNTLTLTLDQPLPNLGHITVTRDSPGGQPVLLTTIDFQPGSKQASGTFAGLMWIPGEQNTVRMVPSWGAPEVTRDVMVP